MNKLGKLAKKYYQQIIKEKEITNNYRKRNTKDIETHYHDL